MRKKLTKLMALGITLTMIISASAFAEEAVAYDVDKINYLYTTGMQLDLSLDEAVSSVVIKKNIDDTTVGNSFTSNGDILTVTFNEKLLSDTVYKFEITSGENTFTKCYRLNTVFYEDFEKDSWEIGTVYSSSLDSTMDINSTFTFTKKIANNYSYGIRGDETNKYLKAEKSAIGAVPAIVINDVKNKKYTGVEFDIKLNHNMNSTEAYGNTTPITEGVVLRYGEDKAYPGIGGNSTLWSAINSDSTFKNQGFKSCLTRGNIGFTMIQDGKTTIENYTGVGYVKSYSDCATEFNQSKYGLATSEDEPTYSSVNMMDYSLTDWIKGQYHYAASINSDNVAAMQISSSNQTAYENVKQLTSNDKVNDSGSIAFYLKGRYAIAANKLGTDIDNIFVFDVEEVKDEWIISVDENKINSYVTPCTVDAVLGDLIIALYDSTGSFVECKIISARDTSKEAPLVITYDKEKSAGYKAFRWDILNGITPLEDAKTGDFQ